MMWKNLFPLFLVVFNLIVSDVAKPASMDKMCKYSQFKRYQIGPVSRQNRRHPSFSVGSVHWLMCRVLQFGESPCIFRSLKISS